eukprot:scaffold1618_cov158-Ochromonas_danica.AAC.13
MKKYLRDVRSLVLDFIIHQHFERRRIYRSGDEGLVTGCPVASAHTLISFISSRQPARPLLTSSS